MKKEIESERFMNISLRQQYATLVLGWAITPGCPQWFEKGFGENLEPLFEAWKTEKIKVYNIQLEPGTNPYIDVSLDNFADMMQDSNIGDEIKITVEEMTREDYLTLPEWGGP